MYRPRDMASSAPSASAFMLFDHPSRHFAAAMRN
jgi:hypothetical protein